MFRTRIVTVATLLAVGLALFATGAVSADDKHRGNGQHRGTELKARLTGAQEVPGPGDPNGSGRASLRIDLQRNQVCFEINVRGVAPITASHIHRGAAGVAGAVVVDLTGTQTFPREAEGCVTADAQLLQEIQTNPAGFYVNAHNSAFPDGAMRGQLMGDVEDQDNDGDD